MPVGKLSVSVALAQREQPRRSKLKSLISLSFSATISARRDINAAPFVMRVKVDGSSLGERLPAGTVGPPAIYTDHVKVTHIIRQAILRQQAILNYIIPF